MHKLNDRDLQTSDMVIARDTLPCHDDYVCQIILKCHYAGQSYERSQAKVTIAYAQTSRA